VDLVYLDPPFNSAQNDNAFFQEKDGIDAASQIHAFEDTWHWDIETKKAYDAVTEQPGKVSDVMQAFYTFLGGNDMMAYLYAQDLGNKGLAPSWNFVQFDTKYYGGVALGPRGNIAGFWLPGIAKPKSLLDAIAKAKRP